VFAAGLHKTRLVFLVLSNILRYKKEPGSVEKKGVLAADAYDSGAHGPSAFRALLACTVGYVATV